MLLRRLSPPSEMLKPLVCLQTSLGGYTPTTDQDSLGQYMSHSKQRCTQCFIGFANSSQEHFELKWEEKMPLLCANYFFLVAGTECICLTKAHVYTHMTWKTNMIYSTYVGILFVSCRAQNFIFVIVYQKHGPWSFNVIMCRQLTGWTCRINFLIKDSI